MFLIAVVIGGIMFPEVVLEALRRMKEKKPNEPYLKPYKLPDAGQRRDIDHRRNNSG